MIAMLLAAVATVATRIVSLTPALTEDLFAIGAGPRVVGVDAYSDRPAAARRLRRVGAMQAFNSEVIASLDPDLVVGIAYQAPTLSDLARTGEQTRVLRDDSLADDLATIGELGRLTGHARKAQQLIVQLQHRFAAQARATRRLAQPRVFTVIGAAPIYTAGAGSYLDDLFAIAHVQNVAAGLHVAFPAVSAETLEASDPDVLIVPRGMSLPDAPPWSLLRAVRYHRIVTIDEDDLSRAGPRVADVVDALIRGIAPYRSGAHRRPPPQS